jgi:hypothetical protein
MKSLLSVLVLAALAPVVVVALQPRPTANTEVYLAQLNRDVMPPSGGTAENISNNPGYDNQPSFTPDGKAILFTSNRDGKQTDIYRYELATKALTELTHTPESEYSPVVTPDGKTFSVIRVEADTTQRLWRFDLDGSNPRRVMTNVTGVGYQAWLDGTHIAVFIVGANGQPNTLQLADTTTDSAVLIDSNPGHGLALKPGAASPTVTYVCKTDAQHWVVKEFSLADRTPKVVMDAVPGSEDLAWDPVYGSGPGSRLFTPKGAHLMVSLGGQPWREAGDFSLAGVDRITRLAINPNKNAGPGPRLAFVAEPVSK